MFIFSCDLTFSEFDNEPAVFNKFVCLLFK